MLDPTALLTVEGLRSGYGGKPVLQGVDLSVRDREVTAVIGRNGVGKSTLMKAVIGLLPTTDGTIRFNGTNIGAETPHERARRGIGYVPQGRDVFPRMSVEENLRVGLSISGARRADFESVYNPYSPQSSKSDVGKPLARSRAVNSSESSRSGGCSSASRRYFCSTSLPKAFSRPSCRTLRASLLN